MRSPLAALAMTLILAAAPAARAGDGILLFSTEPAQKLTLSFSGAGASLTAGLKSDLRVYARAIESAVAARSGQVVLLSYYGDGASNDAKALATARAYEARHVLSERLKLADDDVAVLTEHSPDRAGDVDILLLRVAKDGAATGAARVGWLPALARYVVVCPDGTLPGTTLESWPDDFAVTSLCPDRRADDATAAKPAANVGWDATSGTWVLRCPDGTPLRREAADPDDFVALKRCEPTN